jgi:hypothetical protein
MTGAWVDWFDRYRYLTRTTATVALATIPLVLIYGFGLLGATPGARSGVDIISQPILEVMPLPSYIGIQMAVATILVFVAIFRREERFVSHLRWSLPVVIEALAWGFATGGIVIAALDEIHPVAVVAAEPSQALLDLMVMSAGAGLHEEAVFRLALLPLLTTVFMPLFGVERWAAVLGAVIVSSLVFSAAHHLAGEPFETYVFAYRAVAGLFFAGLFVFRGFAIAAWTHALYDLQVLSALDGT